MRVWAKIGIGALVTLGAVSGVSRAGTAIFPLPPRPGERLQPYEQDQLDQLAAVIGMEIGSAEYTRAKQQVEEFSSTYANHPLATVLHTLPGALLLLLAPIQFSKRIRSRNPRYHRWQGRFLLLMVLASSAPAFFFGVFMPFGGLLETLAILVFGVLFVGAAGRAFVAIRRGQVAQHREWMIRMFSLAVGIAVVRLVNLPLVAIFPYLRETFIASLWLGFGLSLAVGEYWIRLTRRTNRRAQPGHGTAPAVQKAFAGGAP